MAEHLQARTKILVEPWSMSVVAVLLARLDGVRRSGTGRWMARCPLHEDKSPSLSIRETDTGAVLLHCFAGCAAEEVLGVIGMEFADLYPDPLPGHKSRKDVVRPKLSGWDAVLALQFDLTVISIVAGRMNLGEQLPEDDAASFSKSIGRLQYLLGEARRVA